MVASQSPPVRPRILAARLERTGDLSGALAAYEAALLETPDDAGLLTSVARLAEQIQAPEVAAGLWAKVCVLRPGDPEPVNGRARALAELGRFEEAIAVLRIALQDDPNEPRLWTRLGVTLVQDGQTEQALTFFDEAIRLDERSAVATYNRGGAYFDLGRLDAAHADFALARKLARKPADAAMIDMAAALLALAQGDLAAGWDAYEARLSRDLPSAPVFDAPGRRWTPDAPLAGKRLLVVAEQGLGDEVMFANLLPDVLEALGPDGQLTLSVEPRIVELIRRSFARVAVTAHTTEMRNGRRRRATPQVDPRSVDYWAPLASLPRRFRRSLADFPANGGYLRPDPARVAHWRSWLGAGAPAVGITWRSGDLRGDRRRNYPSPDQWVSVLKTPGVRFVNLQYGDCAEDLRTFADLSGAEILAPPGLDIREDIDDLAALAAALDLVVSVGNATGALAGACGCPLVLIAGPSAWPRLGSDDYPWYPQARVLSAPTFREWEPVMQAAQSMVADLAARRSS